MVRQFVRYTQYKVINEEAKGRTYSKRLQCMLANAQVRRTRDYGI